MIRSLVTSSPNKFGCILIGCTQYSGTAFGFNDTVPGKKTGHGRGPRHPATTPPDGRYLECTFKNVEGPIQVFMGFPAAGTRIPSSIPAIGSQYFSAGMTGS
jgi:hypothetical protein